MQLIIYSQLWKLGLVRCMCGLVKTIINDDLADNKMLCTQSFNT